jgi:hypothetical protein
MYFIKGVIGSEDEMLYPADHCEFMTVESSDNKHYTVSVAKYHTHGSSSETITNPILGYLSKTGRFVPITV